MRTPHPTDRLLAELSYCANPHALTLLSRMRRCGDPDDWGGQFTCRTPACANCRGREIGKQWRKAKTRFANVGNDDLAFLSHVIGATPNVDEVGAIFKTFAKDLRNLIDSNRRKRRRWNAVESLLWLETDAIMAGDYIHLAPDKMEQLGELAPMFVHQNGPVWIVTAHGIVSHPGVDLQEVRAEFERRWPGHKRVDLRAFWDNQTKEKNLRGIINYSLKHECRTHLGLYSESWPMSWMTEYYSYLHGWSRGFYRMRSIVGRKTSKKDVMLLADSYGNNKDEYIEPIPFIYTNRHSDIYFN